MAKLAKGYRAYLLGLVVWMSFTPLVAFGDWLKPVTTRLGWILATGALFGLSVTLMLTGRGRRWGVPWLSWVGHWVAMALVVWGAVFFQAGRKDELDGLATLIGSVGLMGLGFGVFVVSLIIESGWRFVRRRREARQAASQNITGEGDR